MSPGVQRVVAVLALLLAALLTLPGTAQFLDDPGNENWIIPVHLLLMAAIGAGVALALPALATAGAPTARRALFGACWGLLAALVAVLVFFFLVSGFRGA